MRFTILAAPGSDPGAARARASAVVAVAGAEDVAAAARDAADPYVLLLAPGVRPHPAAFGGLAGVLGEKLGVLGGATHAAGVRRFGWMLAPSMGPASFDPVPIAAPVAEAGVEALVRGPVDAVAPGMILAARALLLEPLPADPLAASIELCARARAAALDVICRPAFACDAPAPSGDDRGQAAALRALGERRPELAGRHRLPAAMRRGAVEREVRLDGGRVVRVRVPTPRIAVLLHGPDAEGAVRSARNLGPAVASARAVDDAAAALRAEMRVRGDRYVLVAQAGGLPDPAGLDALVESIESAPHVALAAPDDAGIEGRCVLIALARFPQHVEAAGATVRDALASLAAAAGELRRGVRVPGRAASDAPERAPRRATIVLLAGSLPEVMRMTLDAVVSGSRGGDELVAVCPASATTAQRLVAAYPHVRVEADDSDPLLADGANRAIAAASGELIVLIADDVLFPAGTLDRLRDAFARVPALGAAFPAVPGAGGGEGVFDAAYADLAQMRTAAERRAHERPREHEPIDVAVTPALAVTREAFDAVGGIDPAHGPTRRGIAGLVLRLRAAGYAVVRCEDALVHRFDPPVSQNPSAAAAAQQPVPAADAAAIARGFDPAERVPFVRARSGTKTAALHAIAVPVGGAAELERAAVFLAAAARAFDAASPVRVHLLLDGSVAPADAVARVRPILAASGKAMDETVAVRIERVADLAAWRAALDDGVRIVVAAGHARAAFAGLPEVSAGAVREIVEPAPR